MASDYRFNVTLPPQLGDDLQELESALGTTKAEVLRRALVLFKHAVKADKVELTKGTEKQTVLLR